MAETAAAELRRGIVIKGKLSPWFAVHTQATRTMKDLALRLRLGPQSRAPRAPKTLAQPLSGYERMAALEGNDDEAEPH